MTQPDIQAAHRDQIAPPPRFGARISTDFIHGMGKVNGRSVILLDVNAVLAQEEVEMLQAAATTRNS
jgi:purine-binding chemotaxis protein CheW